MTTLENEARINKQQEVERRWIFSARQANHVFDRNSIDGTGGFLRKTLGVIAHLSVIGKRAGNVLYPFPQEDAFQTAKKLSRHDKEIILSFLSVCAEANKLGMLSHLTDHIHLGQNNYFSGMSGFQRIIGLAVGLGVWDSFND